MKNEKSSFEIVFRSFFVNNGLYQINVHQKIWEILVQQQEALLLN